MTLSIITLITMTLSIITFITMILSIITLSYETFYVRKLRTSVKR
jgi:hypothetical protein